MNKKRKKNKSANKNNQGINVENKQENITISELHEKIKNKLDSFNTNKGKRTQRKEQKLKQKENDIQKNKKIKEDNVTKTENKKQKK